MAPPRAALALPGAALAPPGAALAPRCGAPFPAPPARPAGPAQAADPAQGRVHVGDAEEHLPATRFTGGQITVDLVQQPESIECIVADNGPGIPPDYYGKVKERFFRMEASRTSPGTGLGLSLVDEVAHLHRGELVFSVSRRLAANALFAYMT